MAVRFRVKRRQAVVGRGGHNDRSLGFLPLLIMTVIYLLCTIYADDIGPITSTPGFYRMSQPAPKRGCIIPNAS